MPLKVKFIVGENTFEGEAADTGEGQVLLDIVGVWSRATGTNEGDIEAQIRAAADALDAEITSTTAVVEASAVEEQES